jgi:DNA-binding GntR family transcriptional regulator
MAQKDSLPTLPGNNLVTLDTSSLSSRVYDRLLRAIVEQEFKAGQALDVDQLANAFGVSRTPVQTAISKLSDLGLIDVKPRRGTFVAKLTTKEIHELFEIRQVIEIYAVRKGIPLAQDVELRALSEIIDELVQFFSDDQYIDYHAFLDRDRQFHSGIVALAKNERLLKIYDQARILIELTRASAGKKTQGAKISHERHVAIAKALIARDVDKAAHALEAHINESTEAILARLHFPDR